MINQRDQNTFTIPESLIFNFYKFNSWEKSLNYALLGKALRVCSSRPKCGGVAMVSSLHKPDASECPRAEWCCHIILSRSLSAPSLKGGLSKECSLHGSGSIGKRDTHPKIGDGTELRHVLKSVESNFNYTYFICVCLEYKLWSLSLK